jgi:hypothetical protein
MEPTTEGRAHLVDTVNIAHGALAAMEPADERPGDAAQRRRLPGRPRLTAMEPATEHGESRMHSTLKLKPQWRRP